MTELYTVEALHLEHGVPMDTLYDLLGSGELVGFKIGRAWRIHPDDWAAFIDARRQHGPRKRQPTSTTPGVDPSAAPGATTLKAARR